MAHVRPQRDAIDSVFLLAKAPAQQVLEAEGLTCSQDEVQLRLNALEEKELEQYGRFVLTHDGKLSHRSFFVGSGDDVREIYFQGVSTPRLQGAKGSTASVAVFGPNPVSTARAHEKLPDEVRFAVFIEDSQDATFRKKATLLTPTTQDPYSVSFLPSEVHKLFNPTI